MNSETESIKKACFDVIYLPFRNIVYLKMKDTQIYFYSFLETCKQLILAPKNKFLRIIQFILTNSGLQIGF